MMKAGLTVTSPTLDAAAITSLGWNCGMNGESLLSSTWSLR